MILSAPPFSVKSYNFRTLRGTSNQTMALHTKLYEGYVKEANLLTQKAGEAFKVSSHKNPDDSETIRRLTYERNGIELHESYFENLKKADGDDVSSSPLFTERALAGFGSYAAWEKDFIKTAKRRGVGWAVCCQNAQTVSNHWIDLHDIESLMGLKPVLVMDVWEHAFLFDYQPSEREEYTRDFLSNLDWEVVESRLSEETPLIHTADFSKGLVTVV